MIRMSGVRLDIGGRLLLADLNAQLTRGEFIAVLGPNGVGKTTLLRALTGLHPYICGTIELDGTAIEALDASAHARCVAYVTSDDALTDALRVRDVVGIGRFPHHRWWQWNATPQDARAIEDALGAVRMQAYGDRLFTTLSSGERQRAWIAMGLAQATPVLLLDEPTSHLDVRIAHEILALLRDLARNGRSIVCVLHDLNEAAAYADRIMLLGCERLLAYGRPNLVLASNFIEEAYGVSMERVHLPDGRLRIFARDSTSG